MAASRADRHDSFDRPDFVALASALRSARPGLLLTVPVGWINANFADPPDAFRGETAALFDRIHIMSYGMAGPWGWETWHGAALFGETGLTPSSVSSSVACHLASGYRATGSASASASTAVAGRAWPDRIRRAAI